MNPSRRGYGPLNGEEQSMPTTITTTITTTMIVAILLGTVLLALLIPTLVFAIRAANKELTAPVPPPPCDIKIPVYPDASVLTPASVTGAPIALVTGVSRGIGRSTAEQLKSLGYFVIGTSRQPTGPFVFPRYIPPSAPNVDVLLPFDLQDVATFSAFLVALDAALAGPGGGRPLSAIVLNSGRFYYGSFPGTLLKEYGVTPYNNDPFPPGPGAWANYNDASNLISTNPSILLTELITWPSFNVSLPYRINPLALPRIVVVASAVAFTRGNSYTSAYFKKALRDQIDSLRSEIININPTVFGSIFITSIHPSVIDTTLYTTGLGNGIGPIIGDLELIGPIADVWKSFTGLAVANKASDVGKAIVQTIQMVAPPTDALAVGETSFKRESWACVHRYAWCGGIQDGVSYNPLLIEETRADVVSLISNLFASPCLPATVGFAYPHDYNTLAGTSATLSFNTFHLPSATTTFSVSINGLPFVAVPATSTPSPILPVFLTWTSDAPFDFSAYTGTTITLKVRVQESTLGLVDTVTAFLTETVHVIVP